MASQLGIYNGALLICGERFLSSLTENREPRYLLDHVWSENGVRACLEEGQCNFAMRTMQIDYDPAIAPTFGYNRAFNKPTDWVLTSSLCTDEYFRTPATRYWDEAAYWYADVDTIYVRFVSNDALYGLNLGEWPDSLLEFVKAHFASKIIKKLSNSEEEEDKVLKIREKAKLVAKSKAAMAEPTMFPARGSWSAARNRFPNRRDGGNTNGSLIG